MEELKALQAELKQRQADKLRNVDVFARLGYVPTPRQQEFHAAAEFDVLFGGAAGGGKAAR